jgi:cytochrome P450
LSVSLLSDLSHAAINNINRLESIWGPDANEFNPDRYDDTAYPKVSVPGVWGGLLSFIGGPHHCL